MYLIFHRSKFHVIFSDVWFLIYEFDIKYKDICKTVQQPINRTNPINVITTLCML